VLVSVNTTSFSRKEVVEVETSMLPSAAGCAQSVGDKSLLLVALQPYGFTLTDLSNLPQVGSEEAPSVSVKQNGGAFVLENTHVRARFDRTGALTSLYYKPLDREAISEGQVGNRLVLFDDNPQYWDAWDVDVYHLEKRFDVGSAESVKIIEEGPLRASIEISYQLSPNSRLRQRIVLTAVSPRLDFQTHVDWHESHKFLKVEFPIDVRCGHAIYDTAFAHVQRPTHFNTSHELAKFEVCGHKWADLSESGFGVAVLNDCKYGYAVHANTIRLSLLRSPKSPDPTADMGEQVFTYSVLPHADSFQAGGVIEEAFMLNIPLLNRVVSKGAIASPLITGDLPSRCLFSVDHPSVVLETVKKVEEAHSSSLVIRAVESWGGRRKVRIFSHVLHPARVVRVNLLEHEDSPGSELEWGAYGGVELVLKPFQIVTLKLDLQPIQRKIS